jgi:hypothetical protein
MGIAGALGENRTPTPQARSPTVLGKKLGFRIHSNLVPIIEFIGTDPHAPNPEWSGVPAAEAIDKEILLSLSIEFPFGCIIPWSNHARKRCARFQQTWHWFELDSQPDDAVYGEPVSGQNSLLTGKNTGKFAKLGAVAAPALLSCLGIPASLAEFP